MRGTKLSDDLHVLKAACRFSSPVFGPWAYDKWQELNERHFGGELPVGEINWGLTPFGRCIGCYHPHRNLITLHSSLISQGRWLYSRDDSDLAQVLEDPRLAEDTLLHEMVHQSVATRLQYELQGSQETSHNNPAWVLIP